jgi:hypothetical protein
MKKLAYAIAMILLFSVYAWAADVGTVTTSYSPVYSSEGNTNMATLSFAWTTTSAGAASTTTSTSDTDLIAGKYVTLVVTDPDGTSAPTDDYDITIKDTNGVDIVGGALANRDTANTEQTMPAILTGLYFPRPVATALTFAVAAAGSGKSGITLMYLSR